MDLNLSKDLWTAEISPSYSKTSFTYNDMSEEELRDSFKKFTKEVEKVMEANDDLEAGFKLEELKRLIQEALWTNFGEHEVSVALQAAEDGGERAAAAEPGGNLEAYDFTLNHLKELMRTAKEVHSRWRQWIPPGLREDLQSQLRGFELHFPRLFSRKADFIQAKMKEDTEGVPWTAASARYPVASIKLKPTALPKFSGNRRKFHIWRMDWEALQKQGEPTGSREVKKI